MRIAKRTILFILLALPHFPPCLLMAQTTHCDVLVIGEGTGAVAAAIQAARSDANTILINPLPWLGGMLTAAGVSAVDGNHYLPAGLWGEFRQHLRDHYGGAEALATGWVSHTQFEPHVGAMIWQRLADGEHLLQIRRNARFTNIEKKENWVVKVVLENGDTETITAIALVDGTDLGDVATAAGASYDLGMDARNSSGESMAPVSANNIVQDLTYAAILKDFGEQTDRAIPEPPGYDPVLFYCSCELEVEKRLAHSAMHPPPDCGLEKPHPCLTMLNYGKLPNGKYMINWPKHGNDFYANLAEMTPPEREAICQKAKEKTLGFVYYIQQELGFKNLGLADDEFPTHDKLPLMPYHREGRRIRGLVRMNVNHVLNPYHTNLYRTGIAVGDYPIDHHHAENPAAPDIDFPKVPSFNIPIGCLIPNDTDFLLLADKAISVTNIVNGSTRLQPVVIQIGQVAGLMAAVSSKRNISPKNLNVREIQEKILRINGYLLPFVDVPPDHPYFAAIQRVGATGILRGRGVPYQWANQTWFDVDSTISVNNFVDGLQSFENRFTFQHGPPSEILTIQKAAFIFETMFNQLRPEPDDDYFDGLIDMIAQSWSVEYGLENFDRNRPILRGELAVLTEKMFFPFEQKVDLEGHLFKK